MATRTSSAVWEFFLKESSENAQCLLCRQNYSRKGRGTTNLKNHLRSIHKEQYAKLLEEEKKNALKKNSVKTPLQNVNFNANEMKVEQCFGTERDPSQCSSQEMVNAREMKAEQCFNTEWDLAQCSSQEMVNASEIKAEQCFTTEWNPSQYSSQEMDRYISEMLVMDELPFSRVEDVGFMRLMSKAVPDYNLKQRNFYSTMVCTDIYDAVCGQIKDAIRNITNAMGCSISLTIDVWSEPPPGVSLLTLTVHALNRDFEKVNFVLGTEQIEEGHTGDISRKFNDMLDRWEISPNSVHCVVHQAAASMTNVLYLSGLNSIDCAVHKAQLVVAEGLLCQKAVCDIIEKCKRLATHFFHSTTAQDELKLIQEQLQLPALKLLQDSPARWISTLHMLKRMEEMKVSFCVYVAKNPKVPQFSNVEWVILSQCVQALEPYEEFTKHLSDPRSTVADVIPLVACLKNVLHPAIDEFKPPDFDLCAEWQHYQTGAEIVNYMRTKMKVQTESSFAELEQDNMYSVATYTDPRYKGKFFSSSYITEQVQKTVARLCDETANVDVGKNENPSKKRRRDEAKASTSRSTCTTLQGVMALILASSSDEESEMEEASTMDMIHEYHKEKRLEANEDPLLWWKTNSSKYPALAKLARQYLSCPASSVTSERLLSGASNKHDEKRSCFKGEKTEKLLFLKKNLPLLKFEY